VQLVLGVERDLGHGFTARLEGYERWLDRLIVGRLETEEERQRRVAQYSPGFVFSRLQGDIPTAALVTSIPVNGGSGRASGVEIFVSKKPHSPDTRFTGWMSYSLAKAERDAYGFRYPFDYDRRHALSLVGDFRLSSRLELSGSVEAASGLPVTLPSGARVATLPGTDNRGNPLLFPFSVDGGFKCGSTTAR
jgi:hypothetical protein